MSQQTNCQAKSGCRPGNDCKTVQLWEAGDVPRQFPLTTIVTNSSLATIGASGINIRHGTCLYAALRVLDGAALGTCRPKCNRKEFVRSLDRIEAATPGWPGDAGEPPLNSRSRRAEKYRGVIYVGPRGVAKCQRNGGSADGHCGGTRASGRRGQGDSSREHWELGVRERGAGGIGGPEG